MCASLGCGRGGRGGVRGVVVHPSPKPFAPAAPALWPSAHTLSVFCPPACPTDTPNPQQQHILVPTLSIILPLKSSLWPRSPPPSPAAASVSLGRSWAPALPVVFPKTGSQRCRVPSAYAPNVHSVCVFVAIRFLISQPHHLSIEHVPNTHHPRSKASFTLLRHLPCSATLQEPASLVSTHLRTAAPAFQPATPTTRACKPTLSKAALPPKSNAPRPSVGLPSTPRDRFCRPPPSLQIIQSSTCTTA